MPRWIVDARSLLDGAWGSGPAWGYRAKAQPAVEATVLASLSLIAAAAYSEGRLRANIRRASHWVAQLQQPHGAISNLAGPQATWATPYAMLLWHALDDHPNERQLACEWLLKAKGETLTRDPQGRIGHDTTIAGWPWVEGTHSWVEPTAWAVLALRRAGLVDHRRTHDGLRLIRDRAIPSGGWNYGNTTVFGRELRPRPGPTGLALLALAGTQQHTTVVQRACDYLERELPRIRSAQSLCWGLLGLHAWHQRPADAGQWLAETYQRVVGRDAPVVQIAYLLLAAAGDGALAAMGLASATWEALRRG